MDDKSTCVDIGCTCLVFKTTYIDRGKALREGAFSFTRTALFLPLDKRNTRDKARGLCISSERHIGKLGVRCLSTLNRGQDSQQPSHIDSHHPMREVHSLHTGAKKVGTRRRGANFSMIIGRKRGGCYRL